jgi:hypothetical protein
MPFSPACTVTSLRLSNSTNDRLPVHSRTSVYPSSPAFSVRTPSGCDAWLNVPSLYGKKGCASDATKRSRSNWRVRSSLRHHSRRQRMSEASRFNFRTKRKSVSAEFAPVRRLKSKRGGSHFNQQGMSVWDFETTAQACKIEDEDAGNCRLLEQLEAENANLRGKVVDLVIQIRAMYEDTKC